MAHASCSDVTIKHASASAPAVLNDREAAIANGDEYQ
jgi:hypothetical protein